MTWQAQFHHFWGSTLSGRDWGIKAKFLSSGLIKEGLQNVAWALPPQGGKADELSVAKNDLKFLPKIQEFCLDSLLSSPGRGGIGSCCPHPVGEV